jgi:hypothetical protein
MTPPASRTGNLGRPKIAPASSAITAAAPRPAARSSIEIADHAVRLIADPRRWSYSAAVAIGDHEDLSRPDTSIRVQLGALNGETGIGLATDIGTTEFCPSAPLQRARKTQRSNSWYRKGSSAWS